MSTSPLLELPYHPRAPFDTVCLGHLTHTKGLAMFAPRRRGKTSFVHSELIPGAQNHGYKTLYIDLWKREYEPELAIVEAFEASLPKSRVRVSKAKVEIGQAPVKAGMEFTVDRQALRDDLPARLDAAVSAFVGRGRCLVVMDEFQALANTKTPGFIAALRTVLQAHPTLKLFLTGSSRRELSKMLTQQRAPFLGMVMQIELPELGVEFAKDRCALVTERTGRKPAANRMKEVFERVALVPAYLNQIVSIMIVEGIYDPLKAHETWRSRLSQGEAAQLWLTLSELDRQVLMLLVHDAGATMFGEQTLRWHAEQLAEGQPVTPQRVQGALRRLEKAHLITQGANQGEYEIDDDGMRLMVSELRRPRSLPQPRKSSN